MFSFSEMSKLGTGSEDGSFTAGTNWQWHHTVGSQHWGAWDLLTSWQGGASLNPRVL